MPSDDGQRMRGNRISPQKRELARQFRRNMTPAESRLWEQLHASRLCRSRFRRQHVIAGFIVDFYCHSARLAVEVDGPIHASQAPDDARRDEALATFGAPIIRFSNDAVMNDMSAVLRSIAAALTSPPAEASSSITSDAHGGSQSISPRPEDERQG